MKMIPKQYGITALALSTVLTPGAVFAQAGGLEEIIVTAEFREANVQDTPIAITAVTGETMEIRSQTSLFEVASQAPNVTLKPGGPARSGMIAYMRGIGQSDFIAALEPGVGVYVDDVYYSQLTGSLLDLLDLERVEILRGPQGTLSGRNSIGGAIKLYTQKPGEGEGTGSLQVGYGSYDQVDVRGTADLTIFEDTLYARVAGAGRTRDGYIDVLDYACTHPGSGLTTNRGADKCLIDRWGNQNYATGRVQLRWLATDKIEVNVSGDYLNDTSGSPAGVLLWGDRTALETARNALGNFVNPTITGDDGNALTPPVMYRGHNFVPYGEFRNPTDPINDPYVNYATLHDPNTGAIFGVDPATGTALRRSVPWLPTTFPSRNYIKQWGISGNIQWELNDTTAITSITSYREYDTWMTWDSDYSPLAVTMLDNRLDNYSFTQEVRLNSSYNNIDYTLGGFYLDQNSHYEARVILPYALLDFVHGPDPTPASTWALFGHGTWHINDRLNLTAGLRYSDESKDYTHFRHNPDGSDIAVPGTGNPLVPINVRVLGVNGLLASFEGDQLDYRVALDYAVNDDLMAYASVSTGYKSGGVNPRPFFPQQLQTFNPETLTSYEIGFKSTLLDNSLRLNGAFFYTEYDDIQLTLNVCEVPTFINASGRGAPCAKPANVGSAEVKGLEIEAQYYATEELLIDSSISWLDFEYTTVDPFALIGSAIAPLDMITPYTPELKWSIGAQYRFDLAENGNVNFRIDASFQDEVYSEATNTALNLIEDYILSNARIWWDSADDTWTAAVEIQNFTDELYYHTKFEQATSVGQVTGQPGLPRTFMVSLKRRF